MKPIYQTDDFGKILYDKNDNPIIDDLSDVIKDFKNFKMMTK